MAIRALDLLPPAQRFMYEYGCFAAFWGNLDLMMEEALIWHLESADDATTSCQNVNRLTSGEKRHRLTPLLERVSPDAVSALDHLFDVAGRNDWIHGVVLNPHGDHSRLTRFRV